MCASLVSLGVSSSCENHKAKVWKWRGSNGSGGKLKPEDIFMYISGEVCFGFRGWLKLIPHVGVFIIFYLSFRHMTCHGPEGVWWRFV